MPSRDAPATIEVCKNGYLTPSTSFADPFQPTLKTHKLKGRLDGLWACTVEYDCRIIFLFAPDPQGGEDAIVLVDLGSHDEVY